MQQVILEKVENVEKSSGVGRSRFEINPLVGFSPCDQPRSSLRALSHRDGAMNRDTAQVGAGLLADRKLSVPAAAKALGIGQTKLRQMIRNGEIPVLRIMGKMLLMERDVETILQGNYGPLKMVVNGYTGSLPPLPKWVLKSELL